MPQMAQGKVFVEVVFAGYCWSKLLALLQHIAKSLKFSRDDIKIMATTSIDINVMYLCSTEEALSGKIKNGKKSPDWLQRWRATADPAVIFMPPNYIHLIFITPEYVQVFCITPKYIYFIIFSFGSQTLCLILSSRKGVASQNMPFESYQEEYQQY